MTWNRRAGRWCTDALGAVTVSVAVTLAMAVTMAVAGPAHAQSSGVADDSGMAALAARLGAVDTTEDDRMWTHPWSEVVAYARTATGPIVRRYRLEGNVRGLAAELGALPGVTASVDQEFTVPPLAPRPGTTEPVTPTMPPEQAAALGKLASEPLGDRQWGLQAVNAEAAWQVTRGSGVEVAVLDTGAAWNRDLTTFTPVCLWYTVSCHPDPNGHGTYITGILGARLNGTGVAGLANAAIIRPVRVADENGTADLYDLTEGVRWAVARGVEVIHISPIAYLYPDSSAGDPFAVLQEAISDARAAGVTVVAPTGEDPYQTGRVAYPAALHGVIGVSAVTRELGHRPGDSTGPSVDIAAPGEEILSTSPEVAPPRWVGTYGPWVYDDGASAAAAFVSAAAALVHAANPHFSADQVADALSRSAQDLPMGTGDGPDQAFGAGLLQADRAATAAARAPYGLRAPAVTVRVRAVRNASRLWLDVDPDRGSGYWTFRVQRRRSNGTWATLGTTYGTSGSAETRTLDLKKGRYRVKVSAKYGYRAATSASVSLKR